MHAGHLRQRVDDLFGHAVAEIFVLGVGAHVRERQHRDRRRLSLLFGGAELRFERLAQRAKQRALAIFCPAVEVGAVDGTEVERQPGTVEAYRHQDAAIGSVARLAADPA